MMMMNQIITQHPLIVLDGWSVLMMMRRKKEKGRKMINDKMTQEDEMRRERERERENK